MLSRQEKSSFKKVQKTPNFPKGLGLGSMVLVQNWPFFDLFIFRYIGQEKSVLRYSRTKKRLSRL